MTEQFTLDNARMRTLGITRWWHFFQQPSYRKRLVVGVGATLTVACSMNLVMNSASSAPSFRVSTDVGSRLPGSDLHPARSSWWHPNSPPSHLERIRYAG